MTTWNKWWPSAGARQRALFSTKDDSKTRRVVVVVLFYFLFFSFLFVFPFPFRTGRRFQRALHLPLFLHSCTTTQSKGRLRTPQSTRVNAAPFNRHWHRSISPPTYLTGKEEHTYTYIVYKYIIPLFGQNQRCLYTYTTINSSASPFTISIKINTYFRQSKPQSWRSERRVWMDGPPGESVPAQVEWRMKREWARANAWVEVEDVVSLPRPPKP